MGTCNILSFMDSLCSAGQICLIDHYSGLCLWIFSALQNKYSSQTVVHITKWFDQPYSQQQNKTESSAITIMITYLMHIHIWSVRVFHNIVYDLRTQNLSFVAPISEPQQCISVKCQTHILKVARMKVRWNRPNQRFSKSHVIPMEKNEPKIHVFQCPLYKE